MKNPRSHEALFSHHDDRGILGVVEFKNLDFTPQRSYWIHSVPNGQERGHHAHKELKQFVVLIRGSVQITLYDGESFWEVELTQENPSLYIGPGLWRVLRNFSEDAVLVVFCDKPFDEFDYISDLSEFKIWVAK